MFGHCLVQSSKSFLTLQKRNMMLKPDETKSNICDIQVCFSLDYIKTSLNSDHFALSAARY